MGSQEKRQKPRNLSPLPYLFLFGVVLLFIYLASNRAPPTKHDHKVQHGHYMGVDMGTSYVRAGSYPEMDSLDRAIKILPDNLTSRFSPPYVAFTEKGVLYGEEARLQADRNPKNTVFGVNKLIGRKFSEIQAEVESLPFKVIDRNGQPVMSVDVGNRNMQFTPEEIYTMVLTRVREVAEGYIGTKIDEAVIAVPASFGDRQREAVKAAGAKIDLYIQRIVVRPTAASIGFSMDQTQGEGEISFFVCDFDDSLTVHLETVEEGVFELLGSSAAIPLQSSSGVDSSTPFLVDRAAEAINELAADAKMKKGDINYLLMAGSSDIIQDFQVSLRERLGIPVVDVNTTHTASPLDAIVTGAAIQSRVLSYLMEDEGYIIMDVIDLNLGIETTGGMMSTILPRNWPTPTRRGANFTTAADNQPNVLIKLFQGQRALTKHNQLLAQFELALDPAPNGVPIIEVMVHHDANNIVEVTARDVRANPSTSAKLSGIVIPWYKSDELDAYMIDAEMHAAEDAALVELFAGHPRAIGGTSKPAVSKHEEL